MLLGFSKESLGKNNVKLKTKISIMRKKTMFLGLLGAGLMWMPASAILAAQMNNAAMSVQQNQGIKGTVVDATGETLIGASVKVAGTTNGAVTDIDGNFTLNCKPGATLEVSYIGYKTMTVKAANGMKIQMQEDGKALNEVVVTALGIKRDRKALGYGLEEVKGEELTKAKETNVINSLSGKVAGLVVQNTAGGASGSTRVLLRGNTEMAGNNQPLYVVDGVPLDNTNFGSAGEAGGYDLGDGISAINPDDIETMTVLKGPAASALYGSRASHGVILITTKKAEKDKIGVEYNGSFTIDTQLAKWDDVQTTYGMGYNGALPTSSTAGTNSSWGPKADDFVFKYFDGQEHPFMMYPNNASDFFRTGLTAQNSAILSVNSGKTGMRFSVTDMRNKDILPNTNMSRDNFNLRVNTSAGPVDFDFTANYTRENVKNRPALGDSQSNVGKNLMTLAGTYNQAWLKHYEDADGNYSNWNANDQYNKNPYWDLYKNGNTSKKDVFRLTGKAIWNINKHLKLQGTIGTDINSMNFEDFIAKTTPGTPAGKLTDQIFNNRTLNAELLALYNNSWGDFDVNATAGGNIFKVNNKTITNTGLNQQMNGIQNIMNYQEQNTRESMYKKQISSLYASASLGYKHTYYLEGTLRGDKSSTLPTNNNTYVYPSVSGSLVFSEFIKNKKFINYGKIRASWAKVGSDTDPYQLALNYATGKYSYSGYTIGMISNSTQPNKDLKPTMTGSYELGLEMKFFNGRLGLDVTYYNQNSKNQILSLASTNTSGYSYRLVNAGEIQNKGIELALNGRLLQIKDFGWDMGVNFSKNTNKVKSLVDGMDYFELAKATWCGVSVGAQVGENYGAIRGHDVVRNEQGQVVIDAATGLPKVDQNVKTIGNSSWDWTGGFYTTFSYKNFRLSASFDVKVGADIYSMSMRSAYQTGKAKGTLAGREEWYASEEARQAAGMDISAWRESGNCKGLVVDGVIDNGDGTYRKNDIAVSPEDYWKHMATSVQSEFVYDNSYVKCREITLGYTFPESLLGKWVKGLSVSFVARNPFIVWKNIPNIDPDSSYNTSGLGLEYGSLPSRKSYGINVNVKF
jgi:TonB-linked SusC/RagA family outer membrane protein